MRSGVTRSEEDGRKHRLQVRNHLPNTAGIKKWSSPSKDSFAFMHFHCELLGRFRNMTTDSDLVRSRPCLSQIPIFTQANSPFQFASTTRSRQCGHHRTYWNNSHTLSRRSMNSPICSTLVLVLHSL